MGLLSFHSDGYKAPTRPIGCAILREDPKVAELFRHVEEKRAEFEAQQRAEAEDDADMFEADEDEAADEADESAMAADDGADDALMGPDGVGRDEMPAPPPPVLRHRTKASTLLSLRTDSAASIDLPSPRTPPVA